MSIYVSDEVIDAIVEEWWDRICGSEIGDSRTALYRTLRHLLQTKEPPYNYEACDSAFEQWWKFYPRHPRKVRKEKCLGIWRRRWKADELPGIPSMLATLEAQKRHWESAEWKYVPLPQTYLNGGQWEDEVPGVEVAVELSDEEWTSAEATRLEFGRRARELAAAGNWNKMTAAELREELGVQL